MDNDKSKSTIYIKNFLSFFGGGVCRTACEILIAQPGIDPRPLIMRAQSPNHLTAREFP